MNVNIVKEKIIKVEAEVSSLTMLSRNLQTKLLLRGKSNMDWKKKHAMTEDKFIAGHVCT